MSALMIIAAMCHVSISTSGQNYLPLNSREIELNCQKNLIRCVRKTYDGHNNLDKILADCILDSTATDKHWPER